MGKIEWLATQPLKATGTYGLYQAGVEFKAAGGYANENEDFVDLLFSGFVSPVAPLTSRGIAAGVLKNGDEIALLSGFLVGPVLDALGWYGTFQLAPQVAHMLPQTEHMLGGLLPFLIARAGVNLVSHLAADVAGLPFRQRRKMGC